jgi:HSP20 family molecular chaperone IbpA
MSFFPRTVYGADPSFTSLFRLLDDFDSYSREVQGTESQEGRRRVQALRSFHPKFDVRETENTYELHGELAGLDRENVNIEFPEPQTLVVRGRIERSYSAGTPPAGYIEAGNAQVSGAIEAGEHNNHHQSHQATVEDDETENNNKAVTKTNAEKEVEKPKTPAEKYWVSERSIGEFSRTFNFPTRVEQDSVTASLNNGLLTVVVPKAKKHETRRVTIQ